MKPRVRYAPSPTGHLHIGNARTALFNYLFAKRHAGTFIVRIEDTDLARNVESGIASQMAHLRWLGIEPDESIDHGGAYGPYRQLERLTLYATYAEQLLKQGHAYKCYCTSEELEAEREALKAAGDDKLHYSRKCLHAPAQDAPYAIRFKVPENTTWTFDDMVKGTVTFQSDDIGDWVMVKQNGIPTYNFACAIDDHLMAITHVLRGEDHITNTPKQMMVFEALGWTPPVYGHMTLIVNEQGKKLSKRDGAILQFIEQYKDLGYLPEALFNFIALLGWSPPIEAEIFTQDALIEHFDARRLSTSPARFDRAKLTYINQQHIKLLDSEALKTVCHPFLQTAGLLEGKDDAFVDSVIDVFRDRLTYGAEIVSLYHDFFDENLVLSAESREFLRSVEDVRPLLATFADKLTELDETPTPDAYKNLIKETGKICGMKGKNLFMPIRIAASGSMHGPDLPKMMHLLGIETLKQRFAHILQDDLSF
ncbi:MAG: glutamate--tRNA ligase [Acholeplasmatales bacterium]|nr:MAG: glutamate--tRNA ligase [Acholeplasmatales bacterium]